eukprot:m.65051 g.65051  ORF g.65051 m.65051 type:complete len:890 (-) comp13639_c0_seq1:54-2723(-)
MRRFHVCVVGALLALFSAPLPSASDDDVLACVRPLPEDPTVFSSGACQCGFDSIDCSLLNLTTIPRNILPTTKSLSLAANSLTRIVLLPTLPDIQILNLRRNEITQFVFRGVFDNYPKLEELDLGENHLTSLPSGIFKALSKLTTLLLDQNRFAALPPNLLDMTTSLTQLRLERNEITALNADLLSHTTQLSELQVQLNNLTTIPSTLFVNTTVLQYLHLSVNPDLALIPEGTFSNLTSIITLEMLGDASACTATFDLASLTCDCAIGYTGDGTFCEPRDCGVVLGVEFATENCTGDTRYLGDPCPVACDPGYDGGAQEYVCGADGQWLGSLTCLPKDCFSEIIGLHPDGGAVCQGDTRFTGDDCTATCNPGFEGSSANYTCSANGDWVPVQAPLVCNPVECDEDISDLTQHASVDTCQNNEFLDTCTVGCDPGYEGGPATFTCSAEKTWDFVLTCTGVECGRNIDGLGANAKAKCRNQTWFGGTDCLASCDPGYYPEGYPSNVVRYECNQTGFWVPLQHPINCLRKDCGPVVSETLAHEQALRECDQHLFMDTCQPGCEPGYIPGGELTCSAEANWTGFANCTAVDCGSVVNVADNNLENMCADGTTQFDGPGCTLPCKPGFLGQRSFICAENTSWMPADPSEAGTQACYADCGLTVPELDLKRIPYQCNGRSALDGRCVAACPTGLESVGDPVFTCGDDGQWQGTFSCTEVSASSGPLGAGGTVTLIGAVLALLALLVLVVFFVWRRRRRRAQKQEASNNIAMTANPLHHANHDDTSPPRPARPTSGFADAMKDLDKSDSLRSNASMHQSSEGLGMHANPLARDRMASLHSTASANAALGGGFGDGGFGDLAFNSSSTDADFPQWAQEASKTDTIVSGGFMVPVADA